MLPLSWLFALVAVMRRQAYRCNWLPVQEGGAPVLIVGNLTVGGVGKTPLVLWLASWARDEGLRVGIVSRGYGRTSRGLQLGGDSATAETIGDEPLLFARAGFLVAVAERRIEAVNALNGKVDLVIADDGLQHYALARAAEIVVVDGNRGFGNRRLLPAGPLREPVRRLKAADLVLVRNGEPESVLTDGTNVQGHRFDVDAASVQSLIEGDPGQPLTQWMGRKVHAVAGIGFPDRFFNALRAAGLQVVAHPFPDHHRFRPDDLIFGDGLPVLMTGKDAVKCREFAQPHWWSVETAIRMNQSLESALMALIHRLVDQPAGSTGTVSENQVG